MKKNYFTDRISYIIIIFVGLLILLFPLNHPEPIMIDEFMYITTMEVFQLAIGVSTFISGILLLVFGEPKN